MLLVLSVSVVVSGVVSVVVSGVVNVVWVVQSGGNSRQVLRKIR